MTYSNVNQPLANSFLYKLYLAAAGLSIILTCVALCTNNPLELDALVYIKAAQMFHQANLAAAMQIYPWPFFSVLLAMLHKFTQLSYVHAGYLLNGSLQIIITISFIRVIKELNADKQTLLIAALVILLYPFLNKIRPYITRDFGYWAFALWSLVPLIRFSNTPLLRHALSWSLLLVIATLFRIEGAVFLLFTPLVYLLPDNNNSFRQSFYHTVKLYSWTLIASLGFVFWQQHNATLHPADSGRLLELVISLKTSVQLAWQAIEAKAIIIGDTVLTNISADYARIFLLGGLSSLFLTLLITTLNPVYAFLSGYGIYLKLLPVTKKIRQVLIYLILLNVVMLFVFLGQLFFLADRYLIFLNLLLLLWVPFSLSKLYQDWRARRAITTIKPWLFPAVCLLGLVFVTGGIVRFGYSKAYITEAGNWLNKNTPANVKLYSNSAQLLFYAQRLDQAGQIYYLQPPILKAVDQNFLNHYHYLALWLTKKADDINFEKNLPLQKLRLLKSFQNKRGDKVLIFEVRQ